MPILGSDAATALVLEAVEAGYDGRPVLRDFSLSIAAGSIYALLGANGAGKSTVARVACGLLPARRGEVRVGDGAASRGRIGLAPQDIARTVVETIVAQESTLSPDTAPRTA